MAGGSWWTGGEAVEEAPGFHFVHITFPQRFVSTAGVNGHQGWAGKVRGVADAGELASTKMHRCLSFR